MLVLINHKRTVSQDVSIVHTSEKQRILFMTTLRLLLHTAETLDSSTLFMDAWDQTVANIFLNVCKKTCSDDGASCIVIECCYNTLDQLYIDKMDIGHYLYSTIRSEHGPQHCGTNKPKLTDRNFMQQYCTLSIPMIIFLWHDYVASGRCFIH